MIRALIISAIWWTGGYYCQFETVPRVIFKQHTEYCPNPNFNGFSSQIFREVLIERRDWFSTKLTEKITLDDDSEFPHLESYGPYKTMVLVYTDSGSFEVKTLRVKSRSFLYFETRNRHPEAL